MTLRMYSGYITPDDVSTSGALSSRRLKLGFIRQSTGGLPAICEGVSHRILKNLADENSRKVAKRTASAGAVDPQRVPWNALQRSNCPMRRCWRLRTAAIVCIKRWGLNVVVTSGNVNRSAVGIRCIEPFIHWHRGYSYVRTRPRSISSRVFPLVSGTRASTKKKPAIQIAP
jgi:hypothetical protein